MGFIATEVGRGRSIAHEAICTTPLGEDIQAANVAGFLAMLGFKYQINRAIDAGHVKEMIEPTVPAGIFPDATIMWQSASFTKRRVRAEPTA